MHQKIILGNLVPINEDEIVEYIIDGIPDRVLRDQARVSNVKTKAALLEAFERITLWDRKHAGTSGYFRIFIPKCSIIVRPLPDLLKANAKLRFEEREKEAFVRLKDILCNQPVLCLFKVNAIIELHTDASIEG